ncbi:MAG: serine/threonine protein kinase, partial [Verrucomicrobia bacterium]|nr:serine/threonine protein kinase [Verrucomicrobiota bacterium]
MSVPSSTPARQIQETPGPHAEGLPHIPDHRLLRRIGAGSYGSVWLAQTIMGAYRAVKVVHRGDFEDDRPFEREFRGIQKFEPISRQHDSQVDILHVGRTADGFYYVMEVADDERSGQRIDPAHYTPRTLASELKQRGRLPFADCVQIGLALTTALGHLHKHRLIHRDIKPANVIFVNGVPKLADIGLVTEATATRSFVGTEGFIPPEGPGTAQADIYSLGKVLYEMATGRD